MKRCRFCSEEIQDAAVKCRWCGEWLNAGVPASATPANPALLESGDHGGPSATDITDADHRSGPPTALDNGLGARRRRVPWLVAGATAALLIGGVVAVVNHTNAERAAREAELARAREACADSVGKALDDSGVPTSALLADSTTREYIKRVGDEQLGVGTPEHRIYDLVFDEFPSYFDGNDQLTPFQVAARRVIQECDLAYSG